MDTKEIKIKLQEELTTVEQELAEIGIHNPDTDDFEAVAPASDGVSNDEDEVADQIEALEGREGELEALEERRDMIIRAIEKVDENTYGLCDMCENPIGEERLAANPAAITCIEHA